MPASSHAHSFYRECITARGVDVGSRVVVSAKMVTPMDALMRLLLETQAAVTALM